MNQAQTPILKFPSPELTQQIVSDFNGRCSRKIEGYFNGKVTP